MTSQLLPNQKTQNDKYSHDDPKRLYKQNRAINEKAASHIAEQKPHYHGQELPPETILRAKQK